MSVPTNTVVEVPAEIDIWRVGFLGGVALLAALLIGIVIGLLSNSKKKTHSSPLFISLAFAGLLASAY